MVDFTVMKKFLTLILLSLSATVKMAASPHAEIIIPGSAPGETIFLSGKDTTGRHDLIRIDTFKLRIEPPSNGVQFYRNGIVFLAQTRNEVKMVASQLSFGAVEAYFAEISGSSTGKHALFSPSASFSYPCEAMTFCNDFKTMYFTRIDTKRNLEKIYKATFNSGNGTQSGWIIEPAPLNIFSENANFSNPSVSSDGRIMVFASDRKGSIGGMDLYVTRLGINGWSLPVNLGTNVNTPGNEFFPCLDRTNNLYYSSNGLKGSGGYDIFVSRFNGESWEKPVRLSGDINTPDDDVAFTINPADGKSAFFSRRKRAAGDGINLFRVNLLREAPDSSILTITDLFIERTKPVQYASVTRAVDSVVPEAKKSAVTRDTVKNTSAMPASPAVNEQLVYRVQFFSSSAPKGKYQVTVNGKKLEVWEYKYRGLYCQTIGSFSSFGEAAVLQGECRKAGYKDAFVVALRNNIRVTDPALLK